MKVKITERALLQRINRKLAMKLEAVRKTRHNSRFYPKTGAYYIVDFSTNFIVSKHVDIKELGRELGVLKEYEEVEF